jgi:capsular exopolysaccharide synthesis family protein
MPFRGDRLKEAGTRRQERRMDLETEPERWKTPFYGETEPYGDIVADQNGEVPAATMGAGWFDAHQVCDMSDMHDHFYKVLWKLLKQLDKAARPATANGRKTSAKGQAEKGQGAGAHVLTFAGCEAGDGASTMAFNFASAFSVRSPGRVVLIEGNFRKPGLHRRFHAGRRGLCDLIQGRAAMDEAITEVIPEKYSFIQAGRTLENPIALFESDAFATVMKDLRMAYELIIFDSPPLMDAPEAAILASKTDGLIMVLQAEKTRWEVARAVQEELMGIGVPVLGAILNKRQETVPDSVRKRLWPDDTPFWQR